GLIPAGAVATPVKGVGGLIAKGIGQVTESLVHAPAGLYEVGKAVGLDTNDVIQHPASPNHFQRTEKISKAVAKGVAQDVEHPGRNPGYLFMDILGVASPLVEAGARTAEAGRLARAGEVGEAAKALVRKSPLKRATLRYQGHEEEVPLLQNPLLAAAQRLNINVRSRLAAREPTGLAGIVHETKLGEMFDKNLSFARKVGRQADARKRVDHIVNTKLQG